MRFLAKLTTQHVWVTDTCMFHDQSLTRLLVAWYDRSALPETSVCHDLTVFALPKFNFIEWLAGGFPKQAVPAQLGAGVLGPKKRDFRHTATFWIGRDCTGVLQSDVKMSRFFQTAKSCYWLVKLISFFKIKQII